MSYYKKYLKYKTKYIEKKKQIGGLFDYLNNDDITKFNLEYDNITLPHKIKLYRQMTLPYLGLTGIIINNFYTKFKERSQTQLDESEKIDPTGINSMQVSKSLFLEPTVQIIKENGNISYINESFYGKIQIPKYFKVENEKYELLTDFTEECIINGCQGHIYIFKTHTNLTACFNIGVPTVISQDMLSSIYNNFEKWFSKIRVLFEDKNINQITFTGHSHGFVSATIFAFLMMCIESNKHLVIYKDYFSDETYSQINEFSKSQKIDICKRKICVCGGGGYPALWEKELDFKIFYEYLCGRYLHFGIVKKIYIDGKVTTEDIDSKIIINNDNFEKYDNYKVSLYGTEAKVKIKNSIATSDIQNIFDGVSFSIKKDKPNYSPNMHIHKFKEYRDIIKNFFLLYRCSQSY